MGDFFGGGGQLVNDLLEHALEDTESTALRQPPISVPI
jgi:hypothetical protein